MNLSVEEKQELLETSNLQDRALSTLKFMNIEFQKLELKNDIQSKYKATLISSSESIFYSSK
jgi:ATP-dependent Lon protease